MFLLSIHGDLQLGKYSVYNTLCLQLTLLINCNRNTAISSLIAGRIQLYISRLSRIQKLWLPNFQRRRRGGRKFSENNWNNIENWFTESSFWKGLRRADSVVALLSLFAELSFLKTSQEVFVMGQCFWKGKLVCFSLPFFLLSIPPLPLSPFSLSLFLSFSFLFFRKKRPFRKLHEKGTKLTLIL